MDNQTKQQSGTKPKVDKEKVKELNDAKKKALSDKTIIKK